MQNGEVAQQAGGLLCLHVVNPGSITILCKIPRALSSEARSKIRVPQGVNPPKDILRLHTVESSRSLEGARRPGTPSPKVLER